MLEIAGLWKSTNKEGKVYLRGTLGNSTVMVVENKFKVEGSNQPDYRIVVSERKKKGED